jgi:hypothetical protein
MMVILISFSYGRYRGPGLLMGRIVRTLLRPSTEESLPRTQK